MKKDLGGIIAVFPLLSFKSSISTHPLKPVPLKAEVSVLQKHFHEHQSETGARLEESNPRFHAFFLALMALEKRQAIQLLNRAQMN